MNNNLTKYVNQAVVLGAAEGIGKAFSFRLAELGFNLILVDINSRELIVTSDKIKNSIINAQNQPIKIESFVVDLSREEEVDKFYNNIKHQNLGLVVFNAAFSFIGSYEDISENDINKSINLNCRTPSILCNRLLKQHHGGSLGIILMSSLSAEYGSASLIPYSATKAFLKNMAEGLHYEYKNLNVDILAVCPGMVDTPGFKASKPNMKGSKFTPMSPSLIVEEALYSLGKKPIVITGRINRLSYFVLNRLLPRRISSKIINMTIRRLYDNKNYKDL